MGRHLGALLIAAVGAAVALLAGAGTIVVVAVATALLLLHEWAWSPTPLKVPVVMLHSVVGERADRPQNFSIWCPPAMFEGYLRYLKRRRFSTVTLTQLHAHISQGAPLPPKPIVLTFDDGYLDNWVYAVPLLEKYGFTATVFVPSDFVQPGETPRRTLRDLWEGRCREQDLEPYGYMNRAELRAAAQSGVLDVQSHGKSHTWLPISEQVIDFVRPGLPLRQLRPLWWNAFPAQKPFWFQRLKLEDLPWGAPVYANKLALSAPAIEPDSGLAERLIEFVAQRGGRDFVASPESKRALQQEVERYRQQRPAIAKPESAEQFRARLRAELEGSRQELEAITGKPVRFLCWPNGGTCDEAFALLESCGYLAATLPSRAKQPLNHRGTRADRIGRISATSFFRGTTKVFPWVFSFAVKVERNRGNRYMELPIKLIWLYRRLVPAGGATPLGAEQ